jgi:hypothetical protein
MRRFLTRQRNRIWMKAMYSSTIVCLLLYIIIRSFSLDFPMSWRDEIFLFFKITLSGTLMMVLATTGVTFVYRVILKLKRSKRD